MSGTWRLAPSVAWVLVVIPADPSAEPRIVVRHSESACYRALRDAEDAAGEFGSVADADLIETLAEYGTRALVERREFAPEYSPSRVVTPPGPQITEEGQ